jgi:chromosomal replication initiation ATPase DnaA
MNDNDELILDRSISAYHRERREAVRSLVTSAQKLSLDQIDSVTGWCRELHAANNSGVQRMPVARAVPAEVEADLAKVARNFSPIPHGVIFTVVCEHFQIPVAVLLMRSNEHRCVHPRAVAATLLRETGYFSMPKIGLLLGRHHTTILNYLRNCTHLRDTSPEFVALMDELKSKYTFALERAA